MVVLKTWCSFRGCVYLNFACLIKAFTESFLELRSNSSWSHILLQAFQALSCHMEPNLNENLKCWRCCWIVLAEYLCLDNSICYNSPCRKGQMYYAWKKERNIDQLPLFLCASNKQSSGSKCWKEKSTTLRKHGDICVKYHTFMQHKEKMGGWFSGVCLLTITAAERETRGLDKSYYRTRTERTLP